MKKTYTKPAVVTTKPQPGPVLLSTTRPGLLESAANKRRERENTWTEYATKKIDEMVQRAEASDAK